MCIYNSYTRVFLCAHAYTRVYIYICYAHEHKRKALRVQVGIVRCCHSVAFDFRVWLFSA